MNLIIRGRIFILEANGYCYSHSLKTVVLTIMKSLSSAPVLNSEKGEEEGDRRAESRGDGKKKKKKILYVLLCLLWVSIYTTKILTQR